MRAAVLHAHAEREVIALGDNDPNPSANWHHVRFEGDSGVTEWRVWMGGGFNQGWPVKAIKTDPSGRVVEYERVL